MLRTLTLTSTFALAANAVAAEGLTYAGLNSDFTHFTKANDDTAIAGILHGAVEFEFSGFILNGDFVGTAFDAEVNAFDTESQQIFLSAGYRLMPEILVGAGFGVVSGDDYEETLYEAYGQYDSGDFGVGVNVIINENDDSFTSLYSELNTGNIFNVGGVVTVSSIEDYGTDYYLSAGFDDRGSFALAYFTGNTEIDSTLFGLHGGYQVNPQTRVIGGYLTNVGKDSSDVFAFAAGAGYQVADGAWLDATIGGVDLEGSQLINTFGVAFTFESGERTRIDRRMSADHSDSLMSTGYGSLLFANAL
ncbi:hypothetical protein [Yoonia maritima]|uniref:hypothetical protein n=1 Tax=Yoonia maritima TaxID=1435347 RepID=UPI0037364547